MSKKSEEVKARLRKFSNQLNNNTPKSEQWFYSKFGCYLKLFKRNEPLGRFIPDLISKNQKVIIEVDWLSHDTVEQKQKDIIKDDFYKMCGYKVFRVRAYSEDSYNEFRREYGKYYNRVVVPKQLDKRHEKRKRNYWKNAPCGITYKKVR